MKPYQIIYQQLGGARFQTMTGARNLISHGDNALSFRFSGCKGSNYCKITLNDSDTYEVEFAKIGRAPNFTVSNRVTADMVYGDDLQRIFKARTGLDTHL